MDPRGGSNEDRENGPQDSGVSRRHLITGGLLAIGSSSLIFAGKTRARFSYDASANGVVQINDDPTLNYKIADNSKNSNAAYSIHYQVEWLANFHRIEIRVENVEKDHLGEQSFTEFEREGVVEYPEGGGGDGDAEGDEYSFSLDVFDGEDNLVISKSTTDIADGGGQEEGDFGNSNSTELTEVTVLDDTQNNNTYYTVEYELANVTDEFDEIRVTFDNTNPDEDWSDETVSTESSPAGSVDYHSGDTEDDEFEITVEVINNSGLTVDSHTLSDVADGSDSSWSA